MKKQRKIKMEASDTIRMVETKILKPHPDLSILYEINEAADSSLETLIRNAGGILEPLHVKQDHTIINGHRRWRAALKIGLEEIPCLVIDCRHPDAVEGVLRNQTRIKSDADLANETVILKPWIESLRQAASKRKKATQFIGKGVQKRVLDGGHHVMTTIESRKTRNGKVDRQVADKLGISENKAYKLLVINEFRPDLRPNLGKMINGKKMTVNRAYKLAMKAKKEKKGDLPHNKVVKVGFSAKKDGFVRRCEKFSSDLIWLASHRDRISWDERREKVDALKEIFKLIAITLVIPTESEIEQIRDEFSPVKIEKEGLDAGGTDPEEYLVSKIGDIFVDPPEFDEYVVYNKLPNGMIVGVHRFAVSHINAEGGVILKRRYRKSKKIIFDPSELFKVGTVQLLEWGLNTSRNEDRE